MNSYQRDLLEKQMSRREFIQHIAAGLLLVFGGGFLVQFFDGSRHHQPTQVPNGYGGRSYGE